MKKMILLLLVQLSLAGFSARADRTISGTVYDNADKKPIPGATVMITGTSTATNTGTNGHYSIMVPNGKTTLTFTFIGFAPQTISIGKKDTLDVYLKSDLKALSEVVVVGYGSTQKSPTINSNATIEEIVGKMPGLEVNANGTVTHQGKIMIRGMSYTQRAASVQVVNAYGDQASQTGIKPGATSNIIIRGMRSLQPNDESYAPITENQFLDPRSTPLSTFAVDVDAAGYSNFRRFINNGQLPPPNAVRIEEMINYFHYNLPSPADNEPVAIHTELTTAPWNTQHRLLRIGLKAKDIKTDDLPPSNLVFLLDVSGSMAEPNKLPLVKASMKMLVDQLRPIDHVAIVVYAGEAGLKLASTPGSEKAKIKDVIDQLSAGGSTAGGAGLIMAYQVAKDNFIKKGNNRIILATDGDFNVGASSDKDMEQLIADERDSKVSISILGFGMGNLKDSKMETMADKGHGNYAYIDNITEANKAMVNEFGGTLFTVAKDVKLQIEFNPAKVAAYRLLGYEDRLLNKEDFNNDRKLGGDMGVGHTVTALYEVIPAGVKDSFTTSVDPLKYQKTGAASAANNSPEMATIKFRYKDPDGDQSKMEQVSINDNPEALTQASDDIRFAAAVTELGLILRNSEFKQNAGFDQLIAMAKGAKGKDEDGYRSEFIRLAESAKLMSKE